MVGENVLDYLFIFFFKQSVAQDQNETLMLEWKTLKMILSCCFGVSSQSQITQQKILSNCFSMNCVLDPASLFDYFGFIRETDKHCIIWNMCEYGVSDIPKDCTFVLDGASLLQWIPWVQGSSFDTLCERFLLINKNITVDLNSCLCYQCISIHNPSLLCP